MAEPAPKPGAVLPAALLDELARHGRERPFGKGAIVVTEGEPALAMYLVLEGTLRVYAGDADGHEVELNRLGPGEYFGELLLDGEVRSASVQTTSKARLVVVGREAFERALRERPDLAFHLIQHLIERVRSLSRDVQGLASLDVYQRVVRLFDELAQSTGGQRIVPGPLSQARIAARVGASRSMVNRIVQQLVAGGYIEMTRERIVLLQPLPRHW